MKIKSSRVWLGGAFLPATIEVDKGRITRISDDKPDRDFGDRRILPGFIDVHTHGAYGATANYSTEADMRTWVNRLPAEGVTSFLPSTFTEDKDNIAQALEHIADMKDKKLPGAEILGTHLEGPFINPLFKGAMEEGYILEPTIGQFEEWQKAARGNIKYMTMAVERDTDYALTRHASQSGVVVSIGHSGSTYAQAMLGLANGASVFTHAFNAMRPLRHRESGCAGAMMRSDAYAEAIFDGKHVDPEVLNLLFRTKGAYRVVCVSDTLAAKGAPPGEYEMSGRNITVDEHGSAYITGTNTLSGSTLMFNKGLRMMVEDALIPFDWAVNAVSANPARLLGLDFRIGHIKVGYDADFVVLEDDYSVAATYCKGREHKA